MHVKASETRSLTFLNKNKWPLKIALSRDYLLVILLLLLGVVCIKRNGPPPPLPSPSPTHHGTGPDGCQGPQSSQSVPRSQCTMRSIM